MSKIEGKIELLVELICELENDIKEKESDIKHAFTSEDVSYYQAQHTVLINIKTGLDNRLRKL